MCSRDCFDKVLAVGESNGSHHWTSEKMAKKLKLGDAPTTFTVRGFSSQQTIHTQVVELKFTPDHSGISRATFIVTPYVRNEGRQH